MNATNRRPFTQAQQDILRERGMVLLARSFPVKDVADILGVSIQTVYKWRESASSVPLPGQEASRKRGRPAGSRKTVDEDGARRIVRRIIESLPRAFSGANLWTAGLVGRLIEQECGVTLAPYAIERRLRAWGLVPARPMDALIQRDATLAQQWLGAVYPEIAGQAKAESALVCWLTQTVLSSLPVTSDDQTRFFMVAASAGSECRFMIRKEKPDGPGYVDFLAALCRDARRKLYVIAGHELGESETVQQWVTKNQAKVRLFFLP